MKCSCNTGVSIVKLFTVGITAHMLMHAVSLLPILLGVASLSFHSHNHSSTYLVGEMAIWTLLLNILSHVSLAYMVVYRERFKYLH